MDGFIPMEGDSLAVSQVRRNNELYPARLDYSLSPSRIPDLQAEYPFGPEPAPIAGSGGNTKPFVLDDGVEELEEVLVEGEAQSDLQRARELGMHSFGRVYVLSNQDKVMYNTLANYLRYHRINVSEDPSRVAIALAASAAPQRGAFTQSVRVAGQSAKRDGIEELGYKQLTVFINDVPILDTGMLYQYDLEQVDYIEINRTGLGGGFGTSNGYIKIHTTYKSAFDPVETASVQYYKYPLAYAREKKYYVPKYTNTSDDFFQEFGVIDWKGSLVLNDAGEIVFKIKKPQVNFKYILEGVTAEGTLLSEEKEILLYDN